MGIVLAAVLGVAAVVQGVVNRTVASEFAPSQAILINMVITLVLALAYVGAVHLQWLPELAITSTGHEGRELPWWLVLLPGICGFAIVAGIPLAIEKLGPAVAFIIMVAVQVVVTVGLEWWHASGPIATTKLIAGGLAVVSAVLAAR